MGWSKKKADPLSERARTLTEQIAALEAQIKQLDSKLDVHTDSAPAAPRLRSTALPHGAPTVVHPHAPAAPDEPIFEEVNQNRLKARSEPAAPEHFNDLGVRKYDLAAFLQRVKNHFRGPPTMNPKLVNYLAAGSIQGLRPMRYEKRVARNRVLALVIVILAVLLGLWAILPRH
jgi:hypothetical protein